LRLWPKINRNEAGTGKAKGSAVAAFLGDSADFDRLFHINIAVLQFRHRTTLASLDFAGQAEVTLWKTSCPRYPKFCSDTPPRRVQPSLRPAQEPSRSH